MTMKKLLLTTAVLAALGLPAMAQDGLFRNEMTAGAVRASDLIGARIYASDAAVDANEYAGVQEGWDDIGEINDMIVGREGQVEAVLVDIGGFLGMGERQVAVDMAALRFVSDSATADNADDWFLVMNANRGTLEGAPEWSMTAANTGADTRAGATDGTATNMTATDGAAADAATTATGTGQTATADGTMADPAATDAAPAGDTMADGSSPNSLTRDGYTNVAGTELTADMLQGATAYDAQDANVGEVGDLILAEDGQVQQIVIDVGGFLGMGEKPVALALDQVQILRQTEGGAVRVYVSLTKQELEALPDHKM
jgi:hypothetical protein